MELFDQIIDNAGAERPAFRQAPVGDYLVVVREAKEVKANSGTRGIELNFTLLEYLGDGDMDGVDLSKCRARDTLWISEKSVEFAKEKMARITPEVVGISFRDSLDVLPGNEVVVRVSHETENRDGTPLRTPRLKVDRYYSREWYFANQRKAA
jgi:hypothetical protein